MATSGHRGNPLVKSAGFHQEELVDASGGLKANTGHEHMIAYVYILGYANQERKDRSVIKIDQVHNVEPNLQNTQQLTKKHQSIARNLLRPQTREPKAGKCT